VFGIELDGDAETPLLELAVQRVLAVEEDSR
jgi:hypothetical protein